MSDTAIVIVLFFTHLLAFVGGGYLGWRLGSKVKAAAVAAGQVLKK